ncbi:RNase H1/viroplasmin domain-containing protein, partial [Romboutsia sedimentorum]|uniref:RNase H1/viroplasmin domain-containing protein n=1 Tax=Romboutsia sedimentorum TaxID=1368474 RepID=UPI0024DE30F7
MSKKKFYAIKKGNGVENKIVSTWEECKSLVEGYHSEFKSFKTEEDALKYLGIKNKRNKNNKKTNKKSDNGIVNLKIQNKEDKSSSFKVQISYELYNDFMKKCIE